MKKANIISNQPDETALQHLLSTYQTTKVALKVMISKSMEKIQFTIVFFFKCIRPITVW